MLLSLLPTPACASWLLLLQTPAGCSASACCALRFLSLLAATRHALHCVPAAKGRHFSPQSYMSVVSPAPSALKNWACCWGLLVPRPSASPVVNPESAKRRPDPCLVTRQSLPRSDFTDLSRPCPCLLHPCRLLPAVRNGEIDGGMGRVAG